jgi:CPA2 family monovalent cation:H+ antiporter-2
VDSGIISSIFYSLIIASTVITMLLTPLLTGLVSRLYPRLAMGRGIKKLATTDSPPTQAELDSPGNKVVICGYGRVGRNVSRNLRNLGIPYLVIEMDPELVSELHKKGENCIYGDASNAYVLSSARLDKAEVLIVTFPDPLSSVTAVKNALRLNAGLRIVARVHRKGEAKALEQLGVSDLINPEYEASFEFLHRTLAYVGWDRGEIQKTLSKVRQDERN